MLFEQLVRYQRNADLVIVVCPVTIGEDDGCDRRGKVRGHQRGKPVGIEHGLGALEGYRRRRDLGLFAIGMCHGCKGRDLNTGRQTGSLVHRYLPGAPGIERGFQLGCGIRDPEEHGSLFHKRVLLN